jgi:hypothetical protein
MLRFCHSRDDGRGLAVLPGVIERCRRGGAGEREEADQRDAEARDRSA